MGGQEAINIVETNRVDLLLLDIMMLRFPSHFLYCLHLTEQLPLLWNNLLEVIMASLNERISSAIVPTKPVLNTKWD